MLGCPLNPVQVVNCLHLYSALSSPKTPKCFTLQSSTHSYTHSHTGSGKLHCSHSCPGQTENNKAAIQSAPPSPLTTINRQSEELAELESSFSDRLLHPRYSKEH
ncbi:hypothetical protein AMECASPLE_007814 [Ameca splendens]|uniref:Uncharacterized protein n=1 Tax=Ameca splendens TaxID=208324 RepID=A0ABV0Z9T6_9TELE